LPGLKCPVWLRAAIAGRVVHHHRAKAVILLQKL
jgi:hypothetical protein